MPELSLLEYLLTAGHPDDCPPPEDVAIDDDPTFTAPCMECGLWVECPHDLEVPSYV
jgi:hypothetical protein